MVSDTQAKFHLNLIRERHSQAVVAFDNLIKAYTRADMQRIQDANQSLVDAIEKLKDVLAAQHWPTWLKELHSKTLLYHNNHANGPATWKAHLEALMEYAKPLRGEAWHLSDVKPDALDVEAIVDRVRTENRIPDLYQATIDVLSRILESGEIDSVKAVNDLEKIIESLRAARKGSFSTQSFMWTFARKFAANLLKNYAEESKIGPLIKAWNQTRDDLDGAIETTKEEIAREIGEAAKELFQSQALIPHIDSGITNLPNASVDRDERSA